jgi:regulator of replication initiation timing
MFNLNDIEEIILGMAELVRENRYLRKKNEELSEDLRESKSRLNDMYKSSQESVANMLVGALAMSYKESGDMEMAEHFASKIDTD